MNPGFDILYLGHNYGTSRHRADALRRLGNKVEIIDLWDFFPKIKIIRNVIGKLIYETGAGWLEPYVQRRILNKLKNRHVDIVWSDQCVFCGPGQPLCCDHTDYMVTYAIDDPFGARDKNRFTLYNKSLSSFDLVVVVREPNVAEAYETMRS
jgi:spore maturation protein CgeB